MNVKRNFSPLVVVSSAWKTLLIGVVCGVVLLHLGHAFDHLGDRFYSPLVPLSVNGIAVAFCHGMETDLRQCMHESKVPDPIQPVDNILF